MKSLVDVVAESFAEAMIDKILDGVRATGEEELGVPDEGPFKDMIDAFLGGDSEEGGLEFDNIKDAISSIIREKVFDVIFPQEERMEFVEFLCDELSNLEFNLSNISSSFGFGGDEEEEA